MTTGSYISICDVPSPSKDLSSKGSLTTEGAGGFPTGTGSHQIFLSYWPHKRQTHQLKQK
uniref:Uncharacterized protein n=1 Tax=Lepeophtheirus salmonis TaxID=72036 RepID=A0A0K2UHL6_LEPSM